MAKGKNQKLKLLYLAKIFNEETDEDTGLTMPQLIKRLEDYEISAERKSLYDDINELIDFGMDIKQERDGKVYTYHLVSRSFELAELKLLVDSVQSSKFISERKSKELIKKLECLASSGQARQLQRQVIIAGRVKSMNESTYYSVDDIHDAINSNRQIRFRYFQWNIQKEEVLRHDGKWYQMSPWHLRWDDEYYYLIAYDAEHDDIRHFRVDKMKNIQVTQEPRLGQDKLNSFNITAYTKKLFGMYSGSQEHVTVQGNNGIVGVLIDRFGKDIPIKKIDDEHFEAKIEVAISPQFLGWAAALGKDLKVTGPENVVEQMRDFIASLADCYGVR